MTPTKQARNSGPGAARNPRPVTAPSYTIRGAGSGSHPSGVEWLDPDRQVTTTEAAVLQTFPADYPLRGAKGKQYLQIGNAVPPALAYHVLTEATGGQANMTKALDLFRGAGGWSVACRALGIEDHGVDNFPEANATAEAAGFQTLALDVRDLDYPTLTGYAGLIASPPCQTFSMAGKGAGRAALDAVLEACVRFKSEDPAEWPTYAELAEATGDERTALVLEPLRAALEMPGLEWVAWEQVPTVRPVWEACAQVLEGHGWNVWTGVLQAEAYGVPQTRKRAVLIARRSLCRDYLTCEVSGHVARADGWHHIHATVSEPPRTHSRYYPRTPDKLDEGMPRWVSMAEALGWGAHPRPAMTVTGGGSSTGGAEPFGNAARQGLLREQAAGRWIPRREEAEAYLGDRLPNGSEGADPAWPWNRPSTSVVGSFKPEIIAAPGYRVKVSRQNAPGSVRVTLQEAAVLQSFPADYPWQGRQGKQFLQVGNAVPPGLAYAILKCLVDDE